ncbi:hypothetical protein [Vineibacter terrae]|uniref:hypothetical protein n=1 Tax=Vineibacter terrae TaxID=2586908 RepID=UPI002E320AC9|nr:hypothetical protein [Vineibacter terrae]HEX2887180.1 hypothetical protein [Vineibacter terrae]
MADPITFGEFKSPPNPLEQYGAWHWQQVENAARAAVGMEPVNRVPRPLLASPHHPSTALPFLAGMASPVPSAMDLLKIGGARRPPRLSTDIWSDLGTIGQGLLAAAALTPPGRAFGGAARGAVSQVARDALADSMGFHRKLPAVFSLAPQGEKITSAAIKVDGRIYTGNTHADAIDEFERLNPGKDVWAGDKLDDGFMTSAGRYIQRREATDLAARTKQGVKGRDDFGRDFGVASEDMRMMPKAAPPRSNIRVAATAPDLPGDLGVWGVVRESPTPVPTLPHNSVRAKNPRSPGTESRPAQGFLDVGETGEGFFRGNLLRLNADELSALDIQKKVRTAWKQGHDAVLLTNYKRDKDSIPQVVVVVRNRRNIRMRDAQFDPERIRSPNAMAGLVPLAASGAIYTLAEDDDLPVHP